ncbi:MAG: hypothetical protein ACXV7G_07735 [Halobacteriota archaeon]
MSNSKLAVCVCVTIIAALIICTCGCTSSSNPTTSPVSPTPSSSQTPFGSLAADNLASVINDRYKALNYTVNTPFTMTKDNDTITYRGVVTDPSQFTGPHQRNVTMVLTPSNTTAYVVLNDTIRRLQAQGFNSSPDPLNSTITTTSTDSWMGYRGPAISGDVSTEQVQVKVADLGKCGAPHLEGRGFQMEYLAISFVCDRYYEVITDLQTRVAA